MAKKANKNIDTFIINKKAMAGLAPIIAIAAVLLAKNNPAVILLVIGAVCGIIMGKNLD